jgi:hypothetical protein
MRCFAGASDDCWVMGTVFWGGLGAGWNGACERERRAWRELGMGGAALGASLGVSVSGAAWRQYGKSVSNKARPRRAAQFARGANCRWAIRRGLGKVRPALRISHAGRAGALLASARKQKAARGRLIFVSWRKR